MRPDQEYREQKEAGHAANGLANPAVNFNAEICPASLWRWLDRVLPLALRWPAMKPVENTVPATPKVAPDDRLGAVVPELAPTLLANADLRNVIVLAHRRHTEDAEAPAVEINDNLRPAPDMAKPYRHTPWTVLIAGALLLHLVLVFAFLRAPQPLPDAGLEAISVELEIGDNQPVGIASTPSEAAEAPKPEPEQKTEQARNEPETPVEPDKPEPKLAAAEPEPDRAPPEPEAMATQEKPEPPREEPKPEAAEQPKPEPQQEPQETASKPAAPAMTAQAGGLGAGQSAALKNYFSQVASHLSRHKRFPPDARAAGHNGTAMVSFTVDGSGNVDAVRLAHSSGVASFDAESLAMVKRASPFPAPPSGQSVNFTVPVNFSLR
jgi:protein TonB